MRCHRLAVAVLATTLSASNCPVFAATILMVLRDSTISSYELPRKTQFESWGYMVTTIEDSASQTSFDAAIASADVIYVPETIQDYHLQYKLRTTTKGIAYEQRWCDPEMGFSTKDGDAYNTTQLNITNNSHEITSGFDTGMLTVTTSTQPLGLMRPKLASGMTTLADQNGGVSALTYIDTGGTLANTSAGNSTASGRRVRLPWGGDNTFDFNALNANGLVLTRRAIVWALGQKLVGHWKLDEASGTTAADATPYGQDGAVSGGASWSNRCDGSGVFDFNGSTHYISIADATQLHPNARLSIAAWIKGDSWGSGGEVNAILRKGETDPNNFQLAVADGKVALYLDDSDVGGIRGNTTLNVGTWYHVVATWDGLTAKIYLNGVLDNIPTSRTGTISTDTRPLYIGGRSGADHFDGMIYDVRLHDYALSPAEIGQLYGLVGDWKLDETTGTTAADSSLLGNNGTYQGGVSLAASSPVPGSGALAAVFDGTSGHVPVADESAYDVTGPISVAAWIKVAAFTASGQAILTKGNNAWRLTRNANTNTIQFACTGLSPDYVNGTKNVSDGGWHLLVGVYDGSSLTLYVDGVVDGTVSSTGSISTNDYDVEIGGNSQSGGREFDGAIYDARVYNRALCPAEVQTLYGGGSGTSGVRIIKWVEIQ